VVEGGAVEKKEAEEAGDELFICGRERLQEANFAPSCLGDKT
jgi:hypothetical protein